VTVSPEPHAAPVASTSTATSTATFPATSTTTSTATPSPSTGPGPTAAAAAADWAHQPERSSPRALRAMRWVALALGRRIARGLLWPISLYFLAFGGGASRASRDYLRRALGREPRGRERLAHLHHFAATVLDRVYLLQRRFDGFRVSLSGVEHLDRLLAEGRGALLLGAHIGSFEALRTLGEGRRGLNVAMLMYEHNARQINGVLRAIAPDLPLHVIGLGRPGAMLELRDWLDAGGVAGLLGDRTLAGAASARQGLHRLPFLGAPAPFSDGPLRLAALLRRPVLFMAGLYHGANHYELRFLPVADFSRRAASPAEQDAAVQAALQRYVAILEGLCHETPYNWFNFYDVWAGGAEPSAEPSAEPDAEPVADPAAAARGEGG
jgi:predicted LPLAT superfamily acyltransferase